MKAMKKLLSLLLTGVLLTVAVGCDVGAPETTAPATTTTATTAATTDSGSTICPGRPSYPPKIPEDLNFASTVSDPNDLIVRVAYVEGTNGDYTYRSLKADELSVHHVDVKMLKRDQELKNKLGLELSVVRVSDSVAGMEGAIGTSLLAGDGKYDILAGYQYFDIGMASKGYLLNLADLAKENADYIDLSQHYWAENYNEAMSYQGAYYWITGDIALRYIGGAYCTFVNLDLYNEYLDASQGSVYDLVKDNRWTLDSVVALEKYYESLRDHYNDELPYFFGYEANEAMDGLIFGAGVPFSRRDAETGEISVVLGKENTNFAEFGTKLTTLLKGSEYSHQYPDQGGEQIRKAFMNGEVLMMVDQLLFATTYLDSGRPEKYAVVPMPKLNEDQKNYQTTVSDSCTIFGIAYCSTRAPQAAAALEFLCFESSNQVTPEFYEAALKGQYSRNPAAAEMIDMIVYGTTTDFAVAWGRSLGDPITMLRDYKSGVEKTIERKREDWQQKLDGVTELLGIYSQN